MILKEGIETLIELPLEKKYILSNRMGGEDITWKDGIFYIGDRHLTQEEVDKDVGDNWYIYEIKNINGWDIREPLKNKEK